MDPRDDAELIGDALDDPASFGVVFDRYFATIFRFAARRLGVDLAEDVAADTFVVAFQRLESYNPSYRSALPWLYGIASNLIRNHRRADIRRLQRLAAIRHEEATASAPSESDQVIDDLDTTTALAAALLQLREEDREALLLFAWADLPQQEIARIQGVPAGTVRSRVHRARRLLREHLIDSGQEEDETGRPNHGNDARS